MKYVGTHGVYWSNLMERLKWKEWSIIPRISILSSFATYLLP
jgi:hypothetical protein